jgi:hypothetical protein
MVSGKACPRRPAASASLNFRDESVDGSAENHGHWDRQACAMVDSMLGIRIPNKLPPYRHSQRGFNLHAHPTNTEAEWTP